MAELLKGAPVAAALTEELSARCGALKAAGIVPTLAIVRMGEHPEDISYENAAVKRCEKIGIQAKRFPVAEDVDKTAFLAVIDHINANPAIHGCLMFRPLPDRELEEAACARLNPAKDVDGMTGASLTGVFAGTKAGFPPCTAQACLEILDYYHIPIAGKRAVVVGRSLVVGRPVSMLLLGRNATVTLCHTKTANLAAECRRAEILIAAAGKAGVISGDCLTPGQVVLDVGIHPVPGGGLRGDVDFEAAEKTVKAVTPVPGGVGAVTTAVLAKHVLQAAEKISRLGLA